MSSYQYSAEPLFVHKLLSVAPSWYCDARCRHCFIPTVKRRADDFDPDVFEAILRGLPASVRVVGFTGGEPFALPGRFLDILERISATGRLATVITNGLWAVNWGQGEPLLTKAFRNGLKGISVSLDDYHRPALKVTQVVRTLRYARELGMAVNVRGIGKRARSMLEQVRASGVLDGQENSRRLFSLVNIGQAKRLPGDQVRGRKRGGCLGALDPLVGPRGDVYACCSARLFEFANPVLLRGKVQTSSLVDILEVASRDYLLAALIAWGPFGLYKLLGGKSGSGRQVQPCELCVAMLNDPVTLEKLRERIGGDRELRKELVAWHMLFESSYRPGFLPQFEVA